MMKCPNCGSEVTGGKFCGVCGASLTDADANKIDSSICPNCGAPVSGKFCGKCGTQLAQTGSINNAVSGLFDKIGTKVNKATSDLMAIKSDYSNNTLIYKAVKIPNIQEKTIKVVGDEYVYFNVGGGFEKKDITFTTTENNFLCFFIKKQVLIPNSFALNIDTKIKKIDDEVIKLKVFCDYVLVADVDKFFSSMIDIKQNSWTILDVNNLLFKDINESIIDMLKKNIERDGNLDLSDYVNQIKGYSSDIEELINVESNKYGLAVKNFSIKSTTINIEDAYAVLVKNLYK